MAVKKTPAVTESAAKEKEPLTKARAEFEKFRRERAASRGTQPPHSRLGPSTSPRGIPMPGRMSMPRMDWPAMGPGGSMPFAVPPMPSSDEMPQSGIPYPLPIGNQGPLFENIGKMLHLGVALATNAFAGGLQVLQGFSGASGGCGCYEGSAHPHQGHMIHGCCHGDWHGHDYCGCCHEHHGCCHPGVHNCC